MLGTVIHKPPLQTTVIPTVITKTSHHTTVIPTVIAKHTMGTQSSEQLLANYLSNLMLRKL